MKKIVFDELQSKKIIEMFIAGSSQKQISKQLNLSEHAIRKLIENSNIPERPYKRIGEKHGRLIILDKIGKAKNGAPIVRCKCDCGTIKNFNIGNITYPEMKGTKSCGCYQHEQNISKNPWLSEYNDYIYRTVKKRNYSFLLSVEEFTSICSLPCFYCGRDPHTKFQITGNYYRNGIDRVDNSIGYEINNCVPCCFPCNKMKGTQTMIGFLENIENIYSKQHR